MSESFGRYTLIRRLAAGGMAEIHLARQSGLEGFEKLLVIKRILPHLSTNEEFVKMFLDEARIAARLNHPNVVQIYDLGAIGEHHFIAMEYLHGEDARRVWKQAERMERPLSVAHACRIVMDACSGLDFAHKKTDDAGRPLSIVHRDVSPQNLIVTFAGGVKVVDFGIAKAADQVSVTRSGVVKGKYSYMSPEQAAGRKVDHRTDQFALGIVLWELLTGERLFKRGSDIETLKAVDKCFVPPPSEVNPKVPKSLDAIVLKAMQKRVDDRYPDCARFQLAIEAWLMEQRLSATHASLAEFMGEIYVERLEEERRQGQVLAEEKLSNPGGVSGTNSPPGRSFAPDSPDGSTGPTGPTDSDSQKSPARKPPARGTSPSGMRSSPRSGSRDLPMPEAPPPQRPTHASQAAAKRPIGEDDLREGPTTRSTEEVSVSLSIPVAVANARARRGMWLGIAAGSTIAALAVGFAMSRRETTTTAPEETLQRLVPPVRTTPETVRTTPSNTGGATGAEEHLGTASSKPRLKVTSEPSGAIVTVAGRRVGPSPQEVTVEPGVEVEVAASLEGYRPASTHVTPTRDATVALTLASLPSSMAPAGTSTGGTVVARPVEPPAGTTGAAAPSGTTTGSGRPVASTFGTLSLEGPSGMSVSVDGREGRLPFREAVKAGPHRITWNSRSLDASGSTTLEVKGGETTAQSLAVETGQVQVVVRPVDSYAEVSIGGQVRGTTPMPALTLGVGTHTLTFENRDLKAKRQLQVEVAAGKTQKLVVDWSSDSD